jgi:lipoprotein NlpI
LRDGNLERIYSRQAVYILKESGAYLESLGLLHLARLDFFFAAVIAFPLS